MDNTLTHIDKKIVKLNSIEYKPEFLKFKKLMDSDEFKEAFDFFKKKSILKEMKQIKDYIKTHK